MERNLTIHNGTGWNILRIGTGILPSSFTPGSNLLKQDKPHINTSIADCIYARNKCKASVWLD